MGQKTNSNILRLTINSKHWKTKYYAKTKEESSLYIYNDLEIRKYINRVFFLYGLFIYKSKLHYSNLKLKVYIAFFLTLKFFQIFGTIKNIYKKKKLQDKKYNFVEMFLESLCVFSRKLITVTLILQNLNKQFFLKLTNIEIKLFKKICMKLRKFAKNFFFKETLNILFISMKKKASAKFLSEYLAFQLSNIKKQTFFLIFLKQVVAIFLKSKLSNLKGLKVLIKGRFNGASRARTKLISVGNVGIQTFKANINYNSTTAYTPNGTFGIKLWTNEIIRSNKICFYNQNAQNIRKLKKEN